MLESSSKLTRFGATFATNMAEDYYKFDPAIQAVIGKGFTDEDFSTNFLLNTVFNAGIGLMAKRVDANSEFQKLLGESYSDFDPYKIGVTEKELEMINAGRGDEAMAMVTNRVMNGVRAETVHVAALSDGAAIKIKAVFDAS